MVNTIGWLRRIPKEEALIMDTTEQNCLVDHFEMMKDAEHVC